MTKFFARAGRVCATCRWKLAMDDAMKEEEEKTERLGLVREMTSWNLHSRTE